MSETKKAAAFSFPVRVRFAETDGMGIVYHARYFEYLEAARVALLDELGLPYTKVVEAGYHMAVIEAQIRYRAPAKFDDRLEVELAMEPLEGVKLAIRYKVRRGTTVLVEARTVHAFVNLQGQPMRPPKMFVERVKSK